MALKATGLTWGRCVACGGLSLVIRLSMASQLPTFACPTKPFHPVGWQDHRHAGRQVSDGDFRQKAWPQIRNVTLENWRV
jgi:hypothetical protein